MVENQYIYAVARIRTKEMSLLDKSFFEQLLSCKSYKECLRLLTDKGWGRNSDESAEELLAIERNKTWELIRELVEDMKVFDTFLYGNDYHNLKASIKQVYKNEDVPNIYINQGTIPSEVIYKAAKEHDFSLLPEYMREVAEEAYQVMMHTGDSQLCDVIIDKASLETLYKKGKESANELFKKYAELKAASADINIALRGLKTGKNKEFFLRALVDCDTLDKTRLMEAALENKEAIFSYLSTTVYADAIDAIKDSQAAFEKWCDNLIIRFIKPQKYNPFTVSPLAAYILARENEMKSVRIVLSGKLNNLPEESIRERLREMYV